MDYEYEASGGINVTGQTSVRLLVNPARYQAFKFAIGELCGIVPGKSLVPQTIVSASFDGTRVVYGVQNSRGDVHIVWEGLCLNQSEFHEYKLELANSKYKAAQSKLARLGG